MSKLTARMQASLASMIRINDAGRSALINPLTGHALVTRGLATESDYGFRVTDAGRKLDTERSIAAARVVAHQVDLDHDEAIDIDNQMMWTLAHQYGAAYSCRRRVTPYEARHGSQPWKFFTSVTGPRRWVRWSETGWRAYGDGCAVRTFGRDLIAALVYAFIPAEAELTQDRESQYVAWRLRGGVLSATGQLDADHGRALALNDTPEMDARRAAQHARTAEVAKSLEILGGLDDATTEYAQRDQTAREGVARYRRKSTVIEAIQFTGDNVTEIWGQFGTAGIRGPMVPNAPHLLLTTIHGDETPCRVGDWVIPDGAPGTYYPCKPDVFAATYDPYDPFGASPIE